MTCIIFTSTYIFLYRNEIGYTSLNTRNIKGTPLTPVPTVPTLPTISEVKVQEHSSSGHTSDSGSMDLKNIANKSRKSIDETKDTKEAEKPENEFNKTIIPRNASQPAFTTHVQGLPKNGSVPFFDRIRKTSTSERYKPSLSAIKNSRTTLNSNGDIRKSLHLRLSASSMLGSRNNNAEVDVSDIHISQIRICISSNDDDCRFALHILISRDTLLF